ncbi:MAG: diaminopimelate decarboxylase [Elusimicrobia bacterium HGW-Elusimicrobia-2]|nr:MAG: diaminopimelate decarboxylase [Elusimicrobia bacterium HGW-Elusimicrobia-2]
MDYFKYKGSELFAEEIPLSVLAEKYGTPLYVYSKKTLLRHIGEVKRVFRSSGALICFAYKANNNSALLKLMNQEGVGADCVSLGELLLARKAGVPKDRIILNGNGKTDEEIKLALKMNIRMINADSAEDLLNISRVAGSMKTKARVSFRVNPEIRVPTHPHIATGLKESKFGLAYDDALKAYRLAASLETIEICGMHMHIGSQITETDPFAEALKKLAVFSKQLAKSGIRLKYINAGGGLGVKYQSEIPETLDKYAAVIKKYALRIAPKIIIEPGRMLIANTAVLLMRVISNKRSGRKNFVVVDGGMNDIMRPSIYGAYHEALPAKVFSEREKKDYDIVGPICESGDVLAKKRRMQNLYAGELLALRGAGAYGYSMSSNYNLRARPAEVLVDGSRTALIREREDIRKLI